MNFTDLLKSPEKYELVAVYEEEQTGQLFVDDDPMFSVTFITGYMIREKSPELRKEN